MAERVQLSRRKGWKMPPNTIKVDRTTKWGNPCIVGTHGTREECVRYFAMAMAGSFVMGLKNPDGTWLSDSLMAYRKMAHRDRRFLAGKNLACWCPLDKPCHADVLLEIARTYADATEHSSQDSPASTRASGESSTFSPQEEQ